MNRKRLIAIGVTVLLLIGIAVVAISTRSENPAPVLTPSSSPTPSLHPDYVAVENLTKEFIPAWGTYSYKDFGAYRERIQPLVTPEYFRASFGEERLPFRIRSLNRDLFTIKTELDSITSIDFRSNEASVKAKVVEQVSRVAGSSNGTATYIVTFVKTGNRYSVKNVEIQKEDG